MNPSDPNPSQLGPSGLQVELGAKPRFRLRAIWLVSLLASLAVGSVTLVAWLPSSSPTLSPTPNATLVQSPSTQPKISWSQKQLELILSPGETATRSLTFTSDQSLQNIVIEPVPELAPFLSIQPNTFANVPAGQPQSVRFTFSIPATATLGTYDGTVHVRLGSQTLPQTLKIHLDLWGVLTSPLGFQVRYPPQWLTVNETGGANLYKPESQTNLNSPEHYTPPTISIHVFDNPSGISLSDFASAQDDGWYAGYGNVSSLTVGDREAIFFSDADAITSREPALAVFIVVGDRVVLVVGEKASAAIFSEVLDRLTFD